MQIKPASPLRAVCSDMLNKMHGHRYLLAIFAILGLASITSMILVTVRIELGEKLQYRFLIKNLFLAWIPLISASTAYIFSGKHKWGVLILSICITLWLAFFPNAPYILTDLIHLTRITNPKIPTWFDVIMLVWFSWTGMLLGIISLYLIQQILTRRFGQFIGWIFVLLSAALGSIGIYLGRFLRWNSWDLFNSPFQIGTNLWGWVENPVSNRISIGFTLLYNMFFLFVYITIYLFAHLFHQHTNEG